MDQVVPITPAEYEAYLDDEVKAFIAETNSWYPLDTYERTVEEQRQIYDAMCRAFFNGYPEGVSAQDEKAGHVQLRHYRRTDPNNKAAILYVHGGGNVVGGLESHDDVCADICLNTGLDVVAVDYRLAPEFNRSDSFDDCIAGLNWLRKALARPVILVGDSAGGLLTASAMIQERDATDILGLVSIYGGFGNFEKATYTMTRFAFAPLLSAEEVRAYQKYLRLGESQGRSFVVAGAAEDVSGLPPIFATVAECDPIGGQSFDFVERVKAAGGVAVLQLDPGLVHGHLRARHRAEKARASFARVCAAISQMAAGTFPSGAFRD